MTDVNRKAYWEMTDDELIAQMADWGTRVDNASGWSSAYFAAKQCAAIASEGKHRGLEIENKWPIRYG